MHVVINAWYSPLGIDLWCAPLQFDGNNKGSQRVKSKEAINFMLFFRLLLMIMEVVQSLAL